MSVSIPTPMPGDEPDLEQINRLFAEAESLLENQQATSAADEFAGEPASRDVVADAPVTVPVGEEFEDEFDDEPEEFDDDADFDDELDVYEVDGRTRAVKHLAGRVAEAQRLVALQSDDAIDRVESGSVRRLRTKIRDAARKHELSQDPRAAAYKAARVRRVLTSVGFGALITGLTWSTVGVHTTVAAGQRATSAASRMAWLIEPSITAILLLIVAAKAYMAARGKPKSDKTLTRIEFGALGMTLTLNTWKYLPLVANRFSFVVLLSHMVGPLVATAAVMSLPVIWTWLAELPSQEGGTGGTLGTSSGNASGQSRPGSANLVHRPSRPLASLVEEVRQAIADDVLPQRPSVAAVRLHLKCAKQTATQVHRRLFPVT